MYQVDSGRLNTADFSRQLAALVGLSEEEVRKQLGNNVPNRPLLDFIGNRLKGKYKLGILSNSSEDYPGQLLDKIDYELFDDIVLSYKFKIVKPDPEIYKLAAHRLGVPPGEVIFIDDSYGHAEGARTAGMKAIFYNNFGQMKAELAKILTAGTDS
jgi:putative hydrolase of the HAD superfamily